MLSGEKKSLDLLPYLEDIYHQSAKGKDRYNENCKPFIIDQEDSSRLLISHLD